MEYRHEIPIAGRVITGKRLMVSLLLLIPLISVIFAGVPAGEPVDSSWKKIDDGLSIGEFALPPEEGSGAGVIVVVRIDPHRYELKLLTASEHKHVNLTVKDWCRKYNLIAAFNAGMFQKDYKSNVGYMKNYAHINNKRVSSRYLSVAAFNPVNQNQPGFRIFDIDDVEMKSILAGYRTVVQNLRLIKRPGQNRWPQQAKKWSEAALGQDKEGNILFIFSRSAFSMHDFNRIVLDLPINLECAQHLEGGPEASLYFSHKETKLELMGSFENGFNPNQNNRDFWPVPNVFGIVKKN